jgi:hypothetical protein
LKLVGSAWTVLKTSQLVCISDSIGLGESEVQ